MCGKLEEKEVGVGVVEFEASGLIGLRYEFAGLDERIFRPAA